MARAARVTVVVENEFGRNRRAYPAEAAVVPAPPNRNKALDDIRRQLETAIDILRRMPQPREYVALKGWHPAWVDYVQDYPERRVDRIAPNSREVTFMDRRLDWIRMIPDPFIRALVASRAARIKWGWIKECDPKNRSRQQLYNLHMDGLEIIWTSLVLRSRRNGT